jgi:hypothetical protein
MIEARLRKGRKSLLTALKASASKPETVTPVNRTNGLLTTQSCCTPVSEVPGGSGTPDFRMTAAYQRSE